MFRRHSVSMETLYLGEKHPDCSKMFFTPRAKCPLCPRCVSKPDVTSAGRGGGGMWRGVEGCRRPIYKLPFMSSHNSSHTSEHTQRCSQTWTDQTLFRDSCLGARIVDDLIVVGMNGLFEASGKKLFQSVPGPLGWGALSGAATGSTASVCGGFPAIGVVTAGDQLLLLHRPLPGFGL